MVICDEHRFAFVHIPKCAGTTVRARLRPFDSRDGQYEQVRAHASLGTVDFAHIPLRLLARAFPDDLRKLRDYASFAVLRHPLMRFGSSIRQTLHQYEGTYPAEMKPPELRDAVLRMIERLEAAPDWASHEFAFFQRQTDFVELEGKRVVDRLYPLEHVAEMLDELAQLANTPLAAHSRRNRDLAFRARAFVRPAYAINEFLWRHTPEPVHAAIKGIALPLLTRRGSAATRLGIQELPEVDAFVQRHYAADAALYEAVSAQWSETPREPSRAD
jgi:hypothetical protein